MDMVLDVICQSFLLIGGLKTLYLLSLINKISLPLYNVGRIMTRVVMKTNIKTRNLTHVK